MARSPFSPDSLDRRQLLRTSAAAAGLSMMPGRLGAQTAPWSQRPAGTPSQVTFVVWQYGKIYEQIAKQFEQDWSVKINQIIEPNVEPQVAKLTAMYAAGETVDVSQSPMQYLANWRIHSAAHELVNTGKSIPRIAQEVGYESEASFTRAFKRLKGAPPAAWRRQRLAG